MPVGHGQVGRRGDQHQRAGEPRPTSRPAGSPARPTPSTTDAWTRLRTMAAYAAVGVERAVQRRRTLADRNVDRIALTSDQHAHQRDHGHGQQGRGQRRDPPPARPSRSASQPIPARAARASVVKVKSLAGNRNWRKPGRNGHQPPVDAAVAVAEVPVLAERGRVVRVEGAEVRGSASRRPATSCRRPARGPPRSGWCTGPGCPPG